MSSPHQVYALMQHGRIYTLRPVVGDLKQHLSGSAFATGTAAGSSRPRRTSSSSWSESLPWGPSGRPKACEGRDPATPVKLFLANDPDGVEAITLYSLVSDPAIPYLSMWLDVRMAGDEVEEEEEESRGPS